MLCAHANRKTLSQGSGRQRSKLEEQRWVGTYCGQRHLADRLAGFAMLAAGHERCGFSVGCQDVRRNHEKGEGLEAGRSPHK